MSSRHSSAKRSKCSKRWTRDESSAMRWILPRRRPLLAHDPPTRHPLPLPKRRLDLRRLRNPWRTPRSRPPTLLIRSCRLRLMGRKLRRQTLLPGKGRRTVRLLLRQSRLHPRPMRRQIMTTHPLRRRRSGEPGPSIHIRTNRGKPNDSAGPPA